MTNDTKNPVVEQNNDTKPADNENVVNQTADTGSDTPDSVPYARFNQQVKQTKELQSQLNELNAKIESKKIKDIKEIDEAKQLVAEYKDKLDKQEAELKIVRDEKAQKREILLGKLSDEDKEIYGGLSNKQLEDHIAKQQKVPVNTDKSQAVRGSTIDDGVNPFTDMNPDERKKNWGEVLRKYTNKQN